MELFLGIFENQGVLSSQKKNQPPRLRLSRARISAAGFSLKAENRARFSELAISSNPVIAAL